MSQAWGLQHLYHTIVNCKDIEESVQFCKRLGFEVISDRRDAVWPKESGVAFGSATRWAAAC